MNDWRKVLLAIACGLVIAAIAWLVQFAVVEALKGVI